MAIEPVKIPTNIEVEERIIGPLSLRQIIIVMITGGLSYGIWSILQKSGANMNIFLMGIALVPLALGLAFSFVHVNGVSLFTLVLLFIEQGQKPNIRTFGVRDGIRINFKFNKESLTETAPISNQKEHNLTELSSVLDAGIRKGDIPSATRQTNSVTIDSVNSTVSTDIESLWDADDEIIHDIFPSST